MNRSSSSKTSCSTMSTSSLQLRAASSGVDSEVQRTPPNAAAGPTNMLVRPTSRTILRSPLRARSAEEGRRSRSLSSAGPSPVQFSATPPAHAKKPRRSVSPPRTRHHLPPRPSAPAPSSRRSSRAFCDTTTDHHAHDDGLPPLPPTAVATTTYTATAALTSNRNHHNTLDRGGGGSENKKKSLLPATRKRPRHSSRSNQTQRPCLDFEKMQQVKTYYFNKQ